MDWFKVSSYALLLSQESSPLKWGGSGGIIRSGRNGSQRDHTGATTHVLHPGYPSPKFGAVYSPLSTARSEP